MADTAIVDGLERSVQQETDMLADASKLLPDLPPPWVTLLLVVPVSLFLGTLTHLWEPSLVLEGQSWVLGMLLVSIMVYAVPALLGPLFSYGWLKMLGGHSYLYRTAMLAVAVQIVMALLLLGGWVISLIDPGLVPRPEFFLFMNGVTAMFLHLFVFMTSTKRWVAALPASLLQAVLGMVGVFMVYPEAWDWAAEPWRPLLLAAILIGTFVSLGHVAMIIGTRSMSRSYGIDGPSVFRSFLEHWVSGENAGRKEIEDFFRVFSEPAIVKAEVIAFRERGGDPIATVVVPALHPGPWGKLGGSDLPGKMQRTIGDDHGMVFTFHGASDHDLNPVDIDEVAKLGSKVRQALDGMASWSDKASPTFRVTDSTDAIAQAFNGAVMAAQTSSPLPTDDVDWAVGYAIEQEMQKAGADMGAFIDCHNCLLPGAGHVSFGSAKARRIQERVAQATEKAVGSQRASFRIGVGHIPNRGMSCSMGPMGVQVLLVEVGDQRSAWVLADGNNMEEGLREIIRDRLLDRVDEAEVLTTDNHIVNVTVGGFNPIGLKDDRQMISRLCNDSLDLALEDLRDAEAASARVEVTDVLVWGKGNTVRMTSHLNATVSTSKSALLACVVIGFTIGFWAMWYI
jgi:putative membrane protein